MSVHSTAPSSKLTKWRDRLHTFPNASLVQIGRGYDLSTHPAHPRASFPYPSLPPYRVLSSKDILGYLVSLPSIPEIGYLSYILGLVTGLLLTASQAPKWRRFSLVALTIGVLQWYLKRQKAVVRDDISRQSNVSGSPDGPCMVTETIVSVTNSHAGTHADTPYHFLAGEDDDRKKEYNLEIYSGDAIILDITRYLDDEASSVSVSGGGGGGNKQEISADLLTRVSKELGVEWSSVWRVLFCTRTTLTEDDLRNPELQRERQEWPKSFAHFTKDGAEFLVKNAPQLLLVGVDTPSIDHSSASPICQFSHGTFCQAEIAIIENLDFDYLPQLFPPFQPTSTSTTGQITAGSPSCPSETDVAQGTEQQEESNVIDSVNRVPGKAPQTSPAAAHSLRPGSRGKAQLFGTMQTVFHPTQCFQDAKGCSVMFYPE